MIGHFKFISLRLSALACARLGSLESRPPLARRLRASALKQNDGSVLMEFIIILPVYLILLGMAFFFGELSLHGVNLAASADRTVAGVLGGEQWTGWKGYDRDKALNDVDEAISPSEKIEKVTLEYKNEGGPSNTSPSQYGKVLAGKVKDSSFKGSWSWLVGATVKDDYAMTSWTRGLVKTWAHLENMVKMSDPPSGVDDGMGNSVLKDLFGSADASRFGRTTMTGKDLGNVTKYSYVTLTRNAYGRRNLESYRHWRAGSLVDNPASSATWNNCVYREGYFGKNDFELPDPNQSDDNVKHGGNPPGKGTDRPAYERYGQYVTWSE